MLKARLLVVAQEQQLQEIAQIRGDLVKAGECPPGWFWFSSCHILSCLSWCIDVRGSGEGGRVLPPAGLTFSCQPCVLECFMLWSWRDAQRLDLTSICLPAPAPLLQSGASRSATTCSTPTSWSKTCGQARCGWHTRWHSCSACVGIAGGRWCSEAMFRCRCSGCPRIASCTGLLARLLLPLMPAPCNPRNAAGTHLLSQETSDVSGVMDGDITPFMQSYLKFSGQQQGAAAAAAAAAATAPS